VQTSRHVNLAKCRSCDKLACTGVGAGGILFHIYSEAQSVQRLAVSWAVLGSNTGDGEIFRAAQNGPEAYPIS
jgi:hypothetical protein